MGFAFGVAGRRAVFRYSDVAVEAIESLSAVATASIWEVVEAHSTGKVGE
jgi:hypothetical protein